MGHWMRPLLTDRDFDSNLAALIRFIRSEAPGSWNSFYEGDLGKVLIDAIAYDGAIQGYTIDMAALESFITEHRTRESQAHFCAQTGYHVRGATAAVIEAYCRTSSPPPAGTFYTIRKGTKVRSLNGLNWEVSKDYFVESGKMTPVRRLVGYGDVRGSVTSQDGVTSLVNALVCIRAGSSQAILTDSSGNRLSSEVGFRPASDGAILKLTSTLLNGVFTSPPDVTRDEYAIIAVSKLETDAYDGSVLYLDRVWDQDYDFIGKWVIENRNVELIQGESKTDSLTAPEAEADRIGWQVSTGFYPVIFSPTESVIQPGFFGNTLESGEQDSSGVDVIVDGELWRETSSLMFEQSSTKAFELKFDEVGRAQLKFGDGRFGALIPASASVVIKYRVGGGRDGNVPQGSFSASVSALSSGTDSPTAFLSNPYTVGRGGQNRETIEEAKKNLVRFIRTNDRAVGGSDYDYLASNFVDRLGGRIKFAKASLNSNTVPREQNVVWVYCWAEGVSGQLSAPNESLKRSLKDYLDRRKMICDEVVAVDGQITSVPLQLRYRFSRGVPATEVAEDLRSAINDVFASLTPGSTLQLSRLYEAVEAIPAIEAVDIMTPRDNVACHDSAILTNGIQPASLTSLTEAVSSSTLQLPVDDPSLFLVGGQICLFEYGREASSCLVESINGSNITIRAGTPLKSSYTTKAIVSNSDWEVVGWQYERPVNLFIVYDTPNGGRITSITENIRKQVTSYVDKVLRPETPLLRTTIEEIVSSIPGVTSFTVNLGSLDSTAEAIQSAPAEKTTINKLFINGIAF